MCCFSVLNVGYVVQTFLTIMCVFLAYKWTKYVFGNTKNNHFLKPGTVGRCLGRGEELFDVFSVERGGTGNLCVTVCLMSKQTMSHQLVYDALVLLVKRQPMLRAVINTIENGDKYFVIKEISEVIKMLNITKSEVKASAWKDVWFEYARKERENGLLWRVVILQEEFLPDTKHYVNTLMFNFNHSCIDGVSCVKLCKLFLHKINELANNAIDVNDEIPSLDLLPYFHDIVTRKRPLYSIVNFLFSCCGVQSLFRFLMKRMISKALQAMKWNPYYIQFPPSLDISCFAGPSRLMTNVFTKKETKNIVEACKRNHCTVTGALTAAAHLAFCELIKDGMEVDEDVKLKTEFAINARRFCDPKSDEDYLGLFVYVCDELYMTYQQENDVDFWKVAQETTKKIHDHLRKERFVIRETIISEAMKAKEFVNLLDREMVIRLSSCNFISSFGSFNFGQNHQEQTYKLHECFIHSVNHGFAETFTHFNHTINGKMTWEITYNASKIQSHHAEKFVNLCFSRFINIAHGAK